MNILDAPAQVQLRVRFLQRLHRDDDGNPQPPKMLKARFTVPWRLSCRVPTLCPSHRILFGQHIYGRMYTAVCIILCISI